MSNSDLTAQGLRELLRYDPNTGVFTWLRSKGTARSGSSAGSPDRGGYIRICIGGKFYGAHRLAWLYTYGAWPLLEIDHVNRSRQDNRILNLREVTRSENLQNTALSPLNTSGYRGVSWAKRLCRWSAQIKISGKQRHLGYFDDPIAAHQAYVAAAGQLHSHNPATS